MKFTTSVLALVALSALQVFDAPSAAAQQFPAKPVRAILPMTPGGLGDVVLRAIGSELAKDLGQPVVVENRAGAGTLIGADACAKAPADGYTICLQARPSPW